MQMSRKWRKKAQDQDQDFELNIAAIIDCFVVLIAFLLISTSFVAVGIIDAEVAASGEEQIESALSESPVQVTIHLKSDQSIDLHVRGEVERDYTFSAVKKSGLSGFTGTPSWDHEKLIDHLAILKGEWPKLQSAILLADNTVAYQDVIRSMEVARTAISHIALGGYE